MDRLRFLHQQPPEPIQVPVPGGPIPVEPSPLVLEQVRVTFDLVDAPPGEVRVRTGATLRNPGGEAVEADVMVLTGPREPARVRVDGREVAGKALSVPPPPGGAGLTPGIRAPPRLEVTVIPLEVGAGGRAHLLAEFLAPGPHVAYRLPREAGWAQTGRTVLMLRSPRWVRVRSDPSLPAGPSGPGYLRWEASLDSLPDSWFQVRVEPLPAVSGTAAALPSTVAGLLGLGVALRRRIPPWRAAVTAAGVTLGPGLASWTALRASPLPAGVADPGVVPLGLFLSAVAAPLLTALAAAGASRQRL